MKVYYFEIKIFKSLEIKLKLYNIYFKLVKL